MVNLGISWIHLGICLFYCFDVCVGEGHASESVNPPLLWSLEKSGVSFDIVFLVNRVTRAGI